MVHEVNHEADHRHRADEREKQSDALLVVRQRIQSCVQHAHHTEESQAENHQFFHTIGVIKKRFTKVSDARVRIHGESFKKLPVKRIGLFAEKSPFMRGWRLYIHRGIAL